jgi:vitamin B12 transporter
VNLAVSYDITKNFQLFGRVENLLDKEYEEAKGFGTPGLSFFGGIKLSF